jgi:uncharacterized delta-60 repeat protein
MQSLTCQALRANPFGMHAGRENSPPIHLTGSGRQRAHARVPILAAILALAGMGMGMGMAPQAWAAPGQVDETFEPSGVSVTSLRAVGLTPLGGVLIGGALAATNAQLHRIESVALLGPDGILNASFGAPGLLSRATALVVAGDGTVVAAGLETNGLNSVVRRLTATGALDGTLDHGISGGVSPWVYALARQSDGRTLVSGLFTRVDGLPRTNLFRIHTDGTLDESFKTNFTSGGGILALAQQADGKILVGGYFTNVLGVARRGLARLQLDGTVDTTFNIGTGVQGMVKAISVQADGRILIGGHFYSVQGVLRQGIARLTSSGALDMTFDPHTGAELVDGDESPDGPSVNAIAIQGDGRIVVAGQFATFGGAVRSNLARLAWDGSVDENFNPGAGTDGTIHALSIDADGEVIVAGDFTQANHVPRSGVARFQNDGTLPVLPTILTSPTSQTVTLGKPATFTVLAKGTPALRYQWLKSGLPIPGQTNDTMILSSSQFSDAGLYRAKVSNMAGTVNSGSATLTVHPPPVAPVITENPTGSMVLLGDAVSMSSAATGTRPVTWQWRLGNAMVYGATNDTLNLTSVTRFDAGNYTARASNSAGSATSGSANISVIEPLVNQTVRSGTNVSFTVRTFGLGAFTYQWMFDGEPILGATKSTLLLTNVDLDAEGLYSVAVANHEQGLTTPAATLAVQMPPKMVTQPADLAAEEGSNTLLAVAVQGSAPLAYQWRMQGTNLPGQNAATLVFTPIAAAHAGFYSVVITNAYGSVTSRIASLTVKGSTVAQLRAGNALGFAGGTIEVPISLDAVGNENTASFNVAFDPALLSLDAITNGTAIASETQVFINDGSKAAGRVGVLIAAPAGFTLSPGSHHLLTLRFTLASGLGSVTTTPVSFTNTPVAPGLLSIAVQPLPSTYASGTVTIEAGWEADLSPDPDGDGQLTIEDLAIIGQYVAGLAKPSSISQFVRADSAPMPTRGDGVIAAADWTQAARYVAGLDSPVNAGGPQGVLALASLSVEGAAYTDMDADGDPEVSAAPRRRLGLMNDAGNATSRRLEFEINRVPGLPRATVSVRLNALGNENTAGFSVSFEAARLRFLEARRGASLGLGASVVVNTNEIASGNFGVLIGETAGIRLSQGLHEILALDFEILENGPATLTFGDLPVRREIVSSDVQILATTFVAGTYDFTEGPAGPTGPKARPLIRQRSGALLMRWDAFQPGHYVLETSTDLTTWTFITEWDVHSAATLEFTDPDPARGGNRFYRVR